MTRWSGSLSLLYPRSKDVVLVDLKERIFANNKWLERKIAISSGK